MIAVLYTTLVLTYTSTAALGTVISVSGAGLVIQKEWYDPTPEIVQVRYILRCRARPAIDVSRFSLLAAVNACQDVLQQWLDRRQLGQRRSVAGQDRGSIYRESNEHVHALQVARRRRVRP